MISTVCIGRAGITPLSRLDGVNCGNLFLSANIKTSPQPESGSDPESCAVESSVLTLNSVDLEDVQKVNGN